MTTRRDRALRERPAIPAATWPRPRRAPVRGVRDSPGFRIFPPALPTALKTRDKNRRSPLRGAAGLILNSRSSRPLMSTAPSKPDAPGRTRHAISRAPELFSGSTRHVACASACRVHPCADHTCRASPCRPLLSCPPPFLLPMPTDVDARAAMVCTRAAPPRASAVQRKRSYADASSAGSSRAPCPQSDRLSAHGGHGDRPEISAVEGRHVARVEQKQLAIDQASALMPCRQRSAEAVGAQDVH
jgi:hypothetical protein